MRFRPAVFFFALALAAGACQPSDPPSPASQVDLTRYLGRWYVIARIEGAEPGGVGEYFEYRPRDGGGINELTYVRDSLAQQPRLDAETTWDVDADSAARWSRSFWPFTTHHWILHVSDDYQYSVVGEPSRESALVLARAPDIAEWTYAGLLARLAGQGYEVSRLRRVAH